MQELSASRLTACSSSHLCALSPSSVTLHCLGYVSKFSDSIRAIDLQLRFPMLLGVVFQVFLKVAMLCKRLPAPVWHLWFPAVS